MGFNPLSRGQNVQNLTMRCIIITVLKVVCYLLFPSQTQEILVGNKK
jgi:hypothetical protein